MYRANLFVGCVLGMALMTQLPKSFDARVSIAEATTLASAGLSGYAAGYIAMFLLLGQWTGWVLKPRVLWLCQAGFLLGGGGLLLLSGLGTYPLVLVALCGGLIGSAYGAAYVGSIYYSLRLPDGVGRAAGWHETFIGLGNTMGPLLAGAFLSFVCSGISGLATFILLLAAIIALIQAILIPGAARLGAR
jgi:MFS family permease